MGSTIKNLGQTFLQMGKNAAKDPMGFVGKHGIGATSDYVRNKMNNSSASVRNPVGVILPSQKGDILDGFQNGDRTGTYAIRQNYGQTDTVELSSER